MDVIIPTDLVCVLFDPAIPTSSFNYIVFLYLYKCTCMYIYVLNIGLAVKPLMMQFFVVCLPVAHGENFRLIPMYI